MLHLPTSPRSTIRIAGAATVLALLSPAAGTAPAAHAATCGASIPATATITVDEAEPVAPGEVIHLSGSGFTPGQRLAVKMDRDAYGQLGADEAENVPEATRARIEVAPDGTFTAQELIVPRYQADGRATEATTHTVNLLDNDPVTTACAVFATAPAYTASLDAADDNAPGDTITVTGAGWLDRAGTASSTVGVVIEEAGTTSIVASQHLAAHQPHPNERIWALVPREAFTEPGAFSVDVRLPDGTTAGRDGSTVAFGGRAYRVRLWSGQQLQERADITRNVLVGDAFEVSPAPAPPAVPAITSTRRPLVKGKAKVGKRLRVTKGTWSTGVDLTYQWLRDGKRIRGATKARYAVTRKDRGEKLSVKVTAARKGWRSATVTTRAVRIKRR